MTSSAPSVSETLTAYLAGKVPAERIVTVVAAAYWEQGAGRREQLQPLMDIIERAHPGIISLTATADRPGFAVQLAERPFPKRHETALRQAVQAALAGDVADVARSEAPASRPGLFSRILRAVRRLFSA